jgi:SAM-dependent methyltransferase
MVSINGAHSMEKPYYNHDEIWNHRKSQGLSVWGRFSDRVYEKVYDAMKPFIPTDGKILDVGCGAGRFGETLIDRGYDYLGVDESPAAIDLGRATRVQVPLKVVDFARPLPVGFETYDAVTAINSLHCLIEGEHRRQFWQNAKATGGPDGVIVVSTMCGPLPLKHKAFKAPRVFKTPEEILLEAASVGIEKVLHREDLPSNFYNPIPNILLILKRG